MIDGPKAYLTERRAKNIKVTVQLNKMSLCLSLSLMTLFFLRCCSFNLFPIPSIILSLTVLLSSYNEIFKQSDVTRLGCHLSAISQHIVGQRYGAIGPSKPIEALTNPVLIVTQPSVCTVNMTKISYSTVE
jgi:hypothetical protein